MSALPAAPAGSGWGPVYVCKSRSFKVRTFVVYTPQEDLRYIGCVPSFRFETRVEAEAKRDELLASNSYFQDAQGWWRRAV